MSLSRRLNSVRDSVVQACGRADRDPASVRLVAVTKYASVDAITELIDLGHRDFGESRPQQLVERAMLLDDPAVSWHLIGTLQRNKARRVLPCAAVIHSADSFRLLETLDRLAAELQLRPRVLLEVNISGEASKQGFSVEQLKNDFAQIAGLSQIGLAGLMTMAPFSDDPETSRPVFRRLKKLRDELETVASRALPELSMGMSGDYAIAIEEGATIVRVGSALFEE
jgi:pyridoxal phosphate enzyme (YggS family)